MLWRSGFGFRYFLPNPTAKELSPGTAETRNVFYYFLFIVALHGVFGRLVGYFMPVYFKEIGLSGVQTGLYFGVSSVATLVLSLPMGMSTDRRSIRGILMLSFLLVAFSYLGLIFTKSFAVFCVFALFGSFGHRFQYTAMSSLFFKLTGSENRREAGLYQLFTFVFTGVGMLLGGLVIAGLSFRHVFVFSSLANVGFLGLCWFLPRIGTAEIKLAEYKGAVLNPRVLLLCIVFFLSSLHGGAEMVSYGPFLRQVLGLSIRHTGMYTAAGFMVVGLGAYLGVVLLDRGWVRSLRHLMMLGFFLSGVFHILMCVEQVWWSFGFRLVHEVGDGLIFLGLYHGIAKAFHIDKVGGCAAFISLWMSVGSFGGSVLFGYVGDTWGVQWPLIISGVVLAFIPVLLWLARDHQPEG